MRHHYSLPDCSAEVSSRRRPLSLTVVTQSTCRPDRRPRLVCGTRNEKTAGLGWTWYARRCVALEHKGSCTEAGKRAGLTRTPSLRVPQTERVSVGRARRSGWGPGSRDEIPEGLYAPARAATPLPALSLSAKGDGTRSRDVRSSGDGRHFPSQQGPAWGPRGRGRSPSSSSSKSSTKNSRNGGRFGRLRVLTSCWIFADTRLLTGTPGRQKHGQTKGRDGQHLTRGPRGRDAAARALSSVPPGHPTW